MAPAEVDTPGEQAVVRLKVDGMHCAGCVASVERALNHASGVSTASYPGRIGACSSTLDILFLHRGLSDSA